LNSGLVFAALIQFVTLIGFVPYWVMSAQGDVSDVAPLVGVYSVFPIAIGMTCGGERRSWFKIGAAVTSIAAVVVLGISSNGSSSGDGSSSASDSSQIILKWVLFLAVVLIWGSTDLMSVRVGKRTQMYAIVVANIFGIMAITIGGFMAVSWSGLGKPFHEITFGHIAFMLSNAVASWAWYLFVRVGTSGEASVVAPIVNSYPAITAIMGITILHESLNWLKGIGLAMTALGVVGLAYSDITAKSEQN